jgi:hypothetical protein
MINRQTFLLLFCVIVSGCTIHKKNGETITWPAPVAGNQVASTTHSYYPVDHQSYHYPNSTPQSPQKVAYARPAPVVSNQKSPGTHHPHETQRFADYYSHPVVQSPPSVTHIQHTETMRAQREPSSPKTPTPTRQRVPPSRLLKNG